jgi:ATP-binding cassette, subfamily B, bacterial
MSELAAVAFAHDDLPGALESAAVAARLARQRPPATAVAVPPTSDRDALAEFMDRLGNRLGVEVQPIVAGPHYLGDVLGDIAPALIELPGETARWIVLLSCRGRRAVVLDPSLRVRTIPRRLLVDELIRPAAGPSLREAGQLVAAAGLTGRRAERATRALVADRLTRIPIGGLWILRLPAGRPLAEQASRAGLVRRAALVVAVQLMVSILWLAAWWMVGRIALGGVADAGWLLGWGLALASLAPTRALVTWLQGVLAVELGALLRRRLLAGALAMDPDRTKQDGLGRLLGLVLECEALETLGTSGGAQVILAAVELLPVPFTLALGAGGLPHAALLLLWVVPFAFAVRRQLRDRTLWTDERLALTHQLVDSMVGHRTRLSQMPVDRWHDGEDRALVDYLAASHRYDRARIALLYLLARGWLIVAMAALVPAVAAGASASALAISVGGALYAYASFDRLAGGVAQLAAAIEAWRRIAPVYRAAGDAEPPPAAVVARPRPVRGTPVLEAHRLSFAHEGRAALFAGLDLRIRAGDRVLLEGPSGSGKSTFASLLGAQRRPGAGLVLLDELDLDTVGVDRWRKRVALVPQFHENHVMAETFAFNLLMGRSWPPTVKDLADAEETCAALGLDKLLEEMPAGMLQVVGDTGWNLSHGERSRLFLARALLQDPDVLILDESLAALDPELLDQVGSAVLSRARTLVVIAHP